MVDRAVTLPKKNSFFLFGPRQTGKSTLIQARFRGPVWKVDLLEEDTFLEYSKDPSLFRKRAIEKINNQSIQRIFVDEIQRLPALLNEIQGLMQHHACQFILTGSSARKLRRGGANLLGGRAFERQLFPFTYEETKEGFDLERALAFGSLPPLFKQPEKQNIEMLSAYVRTYLQEEINNEGIVRSLGGFSRFLDLAASESGEILNFSNVARECQLAKSTVQSYYEILEDTLIGLRLEPWRKSLRKRLAAHPKFYLFDTGVTNAINKRLTAPLEPSLRGRLFEQWVILETYRQIHYRQSEARIFFWRTNHGAEVDLLIEKHGRLLGAFEIKSSSHVSSAALSGIRAFREEHRTIPCSVICTTSNPYELDGVKIVPWQQYLSELHQSL